MKALLYNYCAQAFSGIIAILMIPQFILRLGPESYGLIAFNSTAMAVFFILDSGVSATAVKKIAQYRAGVITGLSLIQHLTNLEKMFISLGFLGCFIFFITSDLVINNWVAEGSLDVAIITKSLGLIAVIILARWMFMYYRAILIGYEKIIFVSTLMIVSSLLKYVVVIVYLTYFDFGIIHFFYYQFFLHFIELIVVFLVSRSLIPRSDESWWALDLRSIHETLRFSYQLGIVSVLWVLLSQSDRVITSIFLGLENYGKYMMAALAASVITYFNSGFYNVMLPRITIFFESNEIDQCRATYFGFTVVYIILLVPLASVGIFNATTIFSVWTGTDGTEAWVIDVFKLLLLGNLYVPLLSFCYVIQYAAGDVSISKTINFIIIMLLPVAMVSIYPILGEIGIAMMWPLFIVAFSFIGPYLTHNSYLEGINRFWFLKLLVPGYVAGALGAGVFSAGITGVNGILGLLLSYIFSVLFILIVLNSKLRLATRLW